MVYTRVGNFNETVTKKVKKMEISIEEIKKATKKYLDFKDDRDNGPKRRVEKIINTLIEIEHRAADVKELLAAREGVYHKDISPCDVITLYQPGDTDKISVYFKKNGVIGSQLYSNGGDDGLQSKKITDLSKIAESLEKYGVTSEMITEAFTSGLKTIVADADKL
jgi:hypothetical protein